ncbi:MAG: oligosaccharide flippase family protein [Acidimicrobiia bacterium]
MPTAGAPIDGRRLRALALRGGAYLAGRHVASVFIRLGGALLLTDLLGVTDFGRYAGAMALVGVIGGFAMVGTDVYLIRFAGEPSRDTEDQAFTFLLASTLLAVVVGLVLSIGLRSWYDDGAMVTAFTVLLVTLPLNLCWVPALARLERSFRYRALAGLELSGDLVFYATAIGACLLFTPTYWAPVLAQFVQQAWLLVGTAVAARYRPRLRFDRALLDRQLRYGLGVSSASWLQTLSNAVYPLVVGRFAGSAAVGQVALALRVVDAAAFVKRSTGRLAQVALAKLQHHPDQLRKAHAEGTLYQVLATGPFMAAAAGAAALGLSWFYDGNWSEAIDVLPLLLATSLVGTMFNLHSSTLQVRGNNHAVALLRVLQLNLLLGAALVTVPRYGVVGYGLAEVVRLVAFVAADVSLRPIFVPSYRRALPWLLAWLPPLTAPWLAGVWWPLLYLPVLGVAASPAGRQDLALIVSTLRRRTRVRPGSDPERDPERDADRDADRPAVAAAS